MLVLGDDTGTCGEGNDRDDLDLPGGQLDLLQAITGRTSAPVVVVLINCRPATFGAGGNSKYGATPNALLDGVNALLVAWNNGVEGGNAVADLLFGRASPSGRLAANWLSSVGSAGSTSSTWGLARQQSDYDRRWRSSGSLDPVLYPFGFGLDYLEVVRAGPGATFPRPALSATTIGPNGSTTLTITLRNAAPRAGAFAVQVYFRQRVAAIARPNLLLANFTKVWLPASGAATAVVLVKAVELGYYDGWAGRHTVAAGQYDLFVCADSTCGCGFGNGVPGCLATQPHTTVTIVV